MLDALTAEARGDWSNLKGTEYHLVYVIWALLCKQAPSLAFYMGNDLLARPSAPPLVPGAGPEFPTVSLHDTQPEIDVWIQLKATETPWTLKELLKSPTTPGVRIKGSARRALSPEVTPASRGHTLLSTFVLNAVLSERNKRQWQVLLITQAPVRRDDILVFTQDPAKKSDLDKRLDEVVTFILETLNGGSDELPSREAVRQLILAILEQLAATDPIPIALLQAEAERELAFSYPSREAVVRQGQMLLGKLLSETAVGMSPAPVFDAAWLDGALGRPAHPQGLLHTDPAAACDHLIQNSAPTGWDANNHIQRQVLHDELNRFVESTATVFVLVGASGTGKSWALYHWAVIQRMATVRVYLTGSALDHMRSLADLLAQPLRRYSDTVDWHEAHLLALLDAAAQAPGEGPLIVIIDGLSATGSVVVFRNDLARLANTCAERRIKLVFSCETRNWNLGHLDSELPRALVYRTEYPPVTQSQDTPSSGSVVSFELGDFSPSEQAAYLGNYLPEGSVERAVLALRSPQLSYLRNPYLLSKYTRQLPHDSQFPAVDVDSLLDQYLSERLRGVAQILCTTEEDVSAAFDVLVSDLWLTRAGTYSPQHARTCLATFLGPESLAAFRSEGILTASGNVRLAEPMVAELIFSQYLGRDLDRGQQVLQQLRADTDGGVAIAFLRAASKEPVHHAEYLIATNPDWLDAVASGLGFRQDWIDTDLVAALAFLTTLARPTERKHRIGYEACFALGRLAAWRHGRNRRALTWVASLYLSGDRVERSCGYLAVSTLLDLDPRSAEALMRLRMAKGVGFDSFSQRQERAAWLDHALAPLRSINHAASATIGTRLLRRYNNLIEQERSALNFHDGAIAFIEDVDAVTGPIAFHSGSSLSGSTIDTTGVRQLLVELATSDNSMRLAAAKSLRLVLYQLEDMRSTDNGLSLPDGELLQLALEAVCSAVRHEEEDAVLNELLAGAYHLGKVDPDAILDALGEGKATRWHAPNGVVGQCLVLLGNLVPLRPERVAELLPLRLRAYPGWQRAYHSDLLAFTWWWCAEYRPQVRDVLSGLATPDLDAVEDATRPFALRGATTALMGTMCLGHVSAEELLQRRQYCAHYNPLFLLMSTDDFASRHASYLVEHEGWPQLREQLMQVVNEVVQFYVHFCGLAEDQYRCGKLCLEILIQAACAGGDAVPLLLELPRDWPVLYAGWRVLEGGRTEQPVIALVFQLAVDEQVGTSVGSGNERAECLRALRRLLPDSARVSVALEDMLRSPFYGPVERARTLVGATRFRPDQTVTLLEAEWEDEAVLRHWARECSRWQDLLISRVVMRMLENRTIHNEEASELCLWMCVALDNLPATPAGSAWRSIYAGIRSWFHPAAFLDAARIECSGVVLGHSTSRAISLLERVRTGAVAGTAEWVLARTRDHDSWARSVPLRLFATHTDRAYYPPALRLALCALGAHAGIADPVGQFMRDWHACDEVMKMYQYVWHQFSNGPGIADLESAAMVRADQLVRTPWHARLQFEHGDLLLRIGRLNEAKAALQRAVDLSWDDVEVGASALYDLACLYAKQGKEYACWAHLTEALQRHTYTQEQLDSDQDFDGVRHHSWFRALLQELTSVG